MLGEKKGRGGDDWHQYDYGGRNDKGIDHSGLEGQYIWNSRDEL